MSLLVFSLFLSGCSTSAISNVELTTTKASWYSQGTRTASGERLNPKALTAAHRTLPFGTRIKVTNLENNRSVIARVNDRGPFIKSRGLDVSKQVAIELNFIKKGVTKVTYQVIK